ncbi:MAG: HD-GYP domain-containing protein [Thermoanaerobacteraceae bacterium]|uniref:HD-GYP domain-containing protein n=1 Tax=Thermanaeromonas sp. C210 TaxID=2731925 RepID=UPI00155CBD6D|nr:HD-GYP domain-containing protein [Thermanaeromonas sp. C210]MBE3580375.1 HD-GYP domain-containing protein [Thermoanaerobacteraceae bacterium]GFN23127.1 metal-dependent phosphohydrolase [Thermanaeromonas sp. C210]
MLEDTVVTLLQRLYYHSRLTYRHSVHVAAISYQLAQELGLPKAQVRQTFWGALVHDVGKLTIDRSILHKKGPLTEDEWQKMYEHPREGCRLLPEGDDWQAIREMVLYHHEKWDGSGYSGLCKGEIPLGARIIALADALDAMTSSRPYQKKRELAAALQEVKECSGSQFDPQLVEALFSLTMHLLKGQRRPTPSKINEILKRTTWTFNSNEL